MMQVLDLACGSSKLQGATGIDRLSLPGVDYVHDLDTFPYPIADNTFDLIVCMNGMEHFERPLHVMAELYRILRPAGLVKIASPHFSSVDFFTDPTHKHPFSSRSFDYLIEGTDLFRLSYFNQIKFRKRDVRVSFFGMRGFNSMITRIVNMNLNLYERHFAFVVPAHQIMFELEVAK